MIRVKAKINFIKKTENKEISLIEENPIFIKEGNFKEETISIKEIDFNIEVEILNIEVEILNTEEDDLDMKEEAPQEEEVEIFIAEAEDLETIEEENLTIIREEIEEEEIKEKNSIKISNSDFIILYSIEI